MKLFVRPYFFNHKKRRRKERKYEKVSIVVLYKNRNYLHKFGMNVIYYNSCSRVLYALFCLVGGIK